MKNLSSNSREARGSDGGQFENISWKSSLAFGTEILFELQSCAKNIGKIAQVKEKL